MDQTSATRMTLLARKNQLALAAQGANLLKGKREALLKELLALAGPLAASQAALYRRLASAKRALAFTEAFDGRHYLKSLALASRRAIDVRVTEEKFWGVRLPQVEFGRIRRDVGERGISASGVTSRASQTTADFEEVLEILLSIVPKQVRLVRLGEEVRKTSRRVNALDQVLIPRLKGDIKSITQALEEMEREDLFRLRRIKRKKEKQRAQKEGRRA